MNDTSLEYSFWADPATALSVEYSLPAFYELEFLVGEGFRRIPHGGIETGALLVGERTRTGIRIDAFRPIECEHAFGPSFQLSERDLANLREQIGAGIIGWCIAHTRSDLALNSRELQIFDELFPEPRQVTIIAKPERFKSTRFGFFIRDDEGRLRAFDEQNAMILPAPPRSPRREARLPEAEAITPAAPKRATTTDAAASVSEPPVIPEPPVVPEPAAVPKFEQQPPAADVVREQRASETTAPSIPATEETTARSAVLPELPRERRYEPHTTLPLLRERRRAAPEDRTTRLAFAWSQPRLAWLLSGLGILCSALAIYGFYLRSALVTIPLTINEHGATVILSWPVTMTQDAARAELRLNDAHPVALSASEKQTGTYTLQAPGGDIRAELAVDHWYGTTRGVIRYLTSPTPSAVPASQHPSSGKASPAP